jgi:hypothetical protein
MPEKLTPLEQHRQELIKIVEECNINGNKIYKKSDRAPYTYVAANTEDASRMTIQLYGNKVRIWKGNYRHKSDFIKDIDLDKFEKYIYNIVGLRYETK